MWRLHSHWSDSAGRAWSTNGQLNSQHAEKFVHRYRRVRRRAASYSHIRHGENMTGESEGRSRSQRQWAMLSDGQLAAVVRKVLKAAARAQFNSHNCICRALCKGLTYSTHIALKYIYADRKPVGVSGAEVAWSRGPPSKVHNIYIWGERRRFVLTATERSSFPTAYTRQ